MVEVVQPLPPQQQVYHWPQVQQVVQPLPAQQPSYHWPQPKSSLWNLVGTWHGQAMVNDHLNQEVVIERCRNGMLIAVTHNCSNSGDCAQETYVGRWHARSNIYTTQLVGKVDDMYGELVLNEIDPSNASAYHQFEIDHLDHHHLAYQSLETGRHLTMARLQQPESADLCYRVQNLMTRY